jgi:N-acetylneuraminic acid mutarotase
VGALGALASALVLAGAWETRTPLPIARSEVAGARLGSGIAVVAGFLADGRSSSRVDLYSPARNRWSRLPSLPVRVNHAMAAGAAGRLYVFGGYRVFGGTPLRTAFVLRDGRWRRLPHLPSGRAAAGTAVLAGTVYVVGGVGPSGIARTMLAYDLRRGRWRTLAGPTPREHLGVAALGGTIYVIGGRVASRPFDLVESWTPSTRQWRLRSPLPEPRGGTAAGVAAGRIVSAGAESSAGTSDAVYAYDPGRDSWMTLPKLPTARHGLAVVGVGSTIYVIGGGPRPGLAVSGANEALDLRG